MKDPGGWLDGVGRIKTTLYGGYDGLAEDEMYPQAIVIHISQGTFSGLVNMAQNVNARSSWHVSVGREGQRAQHVSLWDAAWHAGIVHRPLPQVQRLIAQFGQNPNRWSIGIEMEGFSVDPGYSYDYVYGVSRPYPAQMIGAVIATIEQVRERCSWLQALSPSEFVERIITHSMIDQGSRAQDPGDFFMETAMPIIRDHFLMQPVVAALPPDAREMEIPPIGLEPGGNYSWRFAVIKKHASEIVRLVTDS